MATKKKPEGSKRVFWAVVWAYATYILNLFLVVIILQELSSENKKRTHSE